LPALPSTGVFSTLLGGGMARRGGKIVPVCATFAGITIEMRDCDTSADGLGGGACIADSRVALGFEIVIGRENDRCRRVFRADRSRDVQEVASAERHRDGKPSQLVNGGAGREPLGNGDFVAGLAD
jgi:hypothetical protein